jgi:cytosine/adenosine deaminase-related metal-dependent hydrolase
MRRSNLLVFGALAASGALAPAAAGCAADERLNPAPAETLGVGGTGGGGAGPTTGVGGVGGAGGQGGQAGPGGQGGGGASGDMAVVECGVALPPPPATGTCVVSKEGTSGARFRGTVLAPTQTLHQGEVLIDADGFIACVGCDCGSAPGAAEASIVDCPEGVISPGLINTHDHIGFANNPPYVAPDPTIRYDHRHEWRKGAGPNKPKISTAGTAPGLIVQFAELRFVMSGATSTVGAGGKAGLLRNLDAGTQLEGLTIKVVESDTFPLDDSSGTMIEMGCNYGGNPTSTQDIESYDGYLPHISEGVNLAARNEFLCTSAAGDFDVIAPQTSIVHAVGITADDVGLIQKDLAKVVWSPRSNVSLYGNTASVTLLDALGVPIALGTDWMPSGSMNILRELRCADELNTIYFNGHFTDADLWKMVTTNAALVVGGEDGVGMLKPGYVADISIFNGKDRKDHRAVVGAEVSDVALVLRGGEVLYGDEALLNSPSIGGENCEALDVCGVAKKACVAQDIGGGVTLQSVVSAGEAIYPLFFCGQPDNEPSCVPYRKGEYEAGPTADDGDGDGIADAADNCPKVFNPVRLLEAAQGNTDGDLAGDACDACPFDAADACTAPDADDIDDDGIVNGADNCPKDTNPAQEDIDKDGHGDACDTCAEPNPGASVCATSIKALRDPSDPGHPAVKSVVSIKDAYVTAVRPNIGTSRGFYIQDASLKPFTGIFVFTGGKSPGVSVGNKITLTGTYEEYFTLSELTNVSVTSNDGGTELPFGPVPVMSPSEIATGGALLEPYESMLVEIGKVFIVVQNADAPMDYDEFTVSDNPASMTGLRIDDLIFDGAQNMGLDNKCPVGLEITKMAGIVNYSFNHGKLEPRSAADITLPAGSPCSPF